MYLATVPYLYSPCPHGNDPQTCDFLTYSTASKCPSSRSPHQVRTGAITWMRNQGIPADVVAERANISVSMLEKHYDKPEYVEEMEKRRRPYLDRLDFDERGEDQWLEIDSASIRAVPSPCGERTRGARNRTVTGFESRKSQPRAKRAVRLDPV